MRLKEHMSRCKGQSYDGHGTGKAEKVKPIRNDSLRTSRGGSDTHMNAWAFSDASVGNREDCLSAFFCCLEVYLRHSDFIC